MAHPSKFDKGDDVTDPRRTIQIEHLTPWHLYKSHKARQWISSVCPLATSQPYPNPMFECVHSISKRGSVDILMPQWVPPPPPPHTHTNTQTNTPTSSFLKQGFPREGNSTPSKTYGTAPCGQTHVLGKVSKTPVTEIVREGGGGGTPPFR